MENDLKCFLLELEQKIENNDLKNLFKYFYYELNESDTFYKEIVNSALNLFYGNFDSEGKVESKENWKHNLKNSIRERYQVIKTKKDGSEVITHKLKEPSKKTLESLQAEDYLEKAKDKWIKIKKELANYFVEMKNHNVQVRRTLIYEAPPYLMSVDEFGDTKFEAEFVFDSKCTSPYANALRNCFKEPAEVRVQELLINEAVGFFDIIPIPMPINSDLRNAWSTDPKFIIEGKRIFVHFFEWAFKVYLFKLNGLIIKESHKLAIGVPLKNAVTLYEYSLGNKEWFFELSEFRNFNFLDQHNFSEKKPEGLWLQMFKNCIIGSSNTPSGDLMRIAFEL